MDLTFYSDIERAWVQEAPETRGLPSPCVILVGTLGKGLTLDPVVVVARPSRARVEWDLVECNAGEFSVCVSPLSYFFLSPYPRIPSI